MKEFKLPYYKGYINFSIDENRVNGVLVSHSEEYVPKYTQEQLVENALQNPINSKKLSELAQGKKNIVVISSDHTRPVPSKITMPIILKEIRKYNNDADITILVATGMHRPTTHDELVDKYGLSIVENEHIVIHDAYDDNNMVFKGILPSGGELWLNKLVDEADLLISEGFIEPHFFAGFSGGRKSVLPGIASKKTVLWNHNAKFISSPFSRAGSLQNNPIHQDMVFAAKQAKLEFILNVVINSEKKIIEAFSGNLEDAHQKGCQFVSSLAEVKPIVSDIAITTNGGYPLDQNMYQTVKGLTAGEACVKQDGVIIIASSCADGSGGDFFYNILKNAKDAHEAWNNILSVEPSKTEFDQWEAQVLARVLMKAHVIVVSTHCDSQMFKDMHMLHATSISEALIMAEEFVGKDKKVTIIPDGIAVIVK